MLAKVRVALVSFWNSLYNIIENRKKREMIMKKKNGFTLAEAMITIAIIGVVSALVLPAVNKLRPDEKKMMYLQAYDTLSQVVMNIAGNKELYPEEYIIPGEKGVDYIIPTKDIPLCNLSQPVAGVYRNNPNIQSLGKLGYLIADAMDVPNGNVTRDNDRYCQDTFPPLSNRSCVLEFGTANGMNWTFRTLPYRPPLKRTLDLFYQTHIFTYNTVVTLDLDPNGTRNTWTRCLAVDENIIDDYNRDALNKCQNDPTASQFRFIILADGTVVPADSLGLMYIKSRTNFVRNNNATLGDYNSQVANIIYDVKQAQSSSSNNFRTNLGDSLLFKLAESTDTGSPLIKRYYIKRGKSCGTENNNDPIVKPKDDDKPDGDNQTQNGQGDDNGINGKSETGEIGKTDGTGAIGGIGGTIGNGGKGGEGGTVGKNGKS